MAFHPMKPETRRRFNAELAERRERNTASLIRRLRERSAVAVANGEDDIWSEMADESEDRLRERQNR